MATKRDYAGMSDLEREIELEMDDELGQEELDEELDEENEGTEDLDREAADTLELDEEAGIDEEADEELGDEEIESADRMRDQEYVERFLEIAGRQFETESEVDAALNETLDGLAQERLFGGFLRRAKKWGSKLAKNKALQSLVKKGLSVASGQLPALKAAMQLAKGNLQGALLNLGKQALGSAIPGGGAALSALGALGFKEAENPEDNREAWENYVQLSREAFEHLAQNVTASADQPIEASRLATNAFQHAVRRAQGRAASNGARRPGAGMATRGRGQVVRYQLRPGQKIVITGGHKLIVRGV